MTKLLMAIILLVAMIIPAASTSLSMSGATQSEVYWQNHNLLDQGVPVLSTDAYNTLTKNPVLTFGVTVSGRKTVYFGAAIPKDIETRKATMQKTSFGLSGPVVTPTGGSSAAYWLMGRKWNTTAPGFKPVIMSLKDDAYLAGTGMSKVGALAAIAAAESTWNNVTNQKPLGGSALTTTANWKYDGINNMAFTPYTAGSTALAATGVWYKTQGIPAGQMYPIVEADMTFNSNSNSKWSCTGETGKLDLQAVVLHEMGHVIGLGDLYGRPTNDGKQIMGYYSGRRVLGNGDAAGAWKLYS